ncbi:hypothethical protein [Staphylococcus caprae]|uniref:Hypothethical protein n=1 Tax=Staphylococcus caprae TaxID=29380 RepID=A0ABN5W5Y2_9STAP|nr:hypothethical protein [Staphylococcus caprae]BBD93436.1 hypothethical protein [Staphylococcus caprae]BBD95938.1 hypothetical protein JMUB898_2386 [Staphylococcus caprae]
MFKINHNEVGLFDLFRATRMFIFKMSNTFHITKQQMYNSQSVMNLKIKLMK